MAFKLIIKSSEIIKGAVVFSVFDGIAAMMLGEFSILRLFGMTLIGGSLYAIEIPSYFQWIQSKSQHMPAHRGKWFKALMAVAYFNPLWIARHMTFIYLLNRQALTWDILSVAGQAFLMGSLVSLIMNFIIQNKIPVHHRFLASSLFSGCMAIFYALSATLLS